MNTIQKGIIFSLLCGTSSFCISVYAVHISTKADVPSIIKDLRHKAEQGDAQAQYRLGRLYDPMLYTYISVHFNPEIYYDQNAPIEENFDIEPNDDEAKKWYHKAANQGNNEAQRIIGMNYLMIDTMGSGYLEAEKWLRKAVKNENAESQYYLGKVLCGDCYGHFRVGDFAPPAKINFTESIKWFELAAKQGHAGAQYRMAAMFYGGRGVQKNDKEALKWISKAIKQDIPDAKILLGHMYYDARGVKQDYLKASKLFHEALKQTGNAFNSSPHYDLESYLRAFIRLGNIYYNGLSVQQDYIEALKWYSRIAKIEIDDIFDYEEEEPKIALKNYAAALEWNQRAAEQGNVEAQMMLAMVSNTPPLQKNALDMVRVEAEQGNADAQFVLGMDFAYRYCVSHNFSKLGCIEAVNWYQKSAEQGNIEAQYSLAVLSFQTQQFHPFQENTEIVKHYSAAAKSGYLTAWIYLKQLAIIERNPEAQFALGQLFAEGCLGVRKDESKAMKMFQMAADNGSRDARRAIEELKAR